MRSLAITAFMGFFATTALSQSTASNEAILKKARTLYDAPFTRGLISFDCAVQFDWKKHFIDFLGNMPPAAVPMAERLQAMPRRVLVDVSGAVVSQQAKAGGLDEIPHAAEVEQIFESVVSNGLGLWVPFARNVVLPVGPTKYTIDKLDAGYKLHMDGPGVEATLLLDNDLYLRSAVSRLPNPVRFATDFKLGPDGLLVNSVTTGATTDASVGGEAIFTFMYQAIDGFRIPSFVTVTPATNEAYKFALTDCKTTHGVVLKVDAP